MFTRLSTRSKTLWGLAALTSLLVLLLLILATSAYGAFRLEYVPGVERSDGIGIQRIQAQPTFWKGRSASVSVVVAPRPVVAPKASARCGGDLPPCWVMMRESRGDPNAHNRTGCSGRGCFGKWQFDPNTGNGTGSEAQQDAEARRVWDNGRGCSHWAACG